MDFADYKIKVSAGGLFRAERDAIPSDSFFIHMIALKRALEQIQGGILI